MRREFPVVGIIAVITPDDDVVTQEVTRSHRQRNLEACVGQRFLMYRSVVEIHAVERQAQVTLLRNHIGEEHELEILVYDLRVAQRQGKGIAPFGAITFIGSAQFYRFDDLDLVKERLEPRRKFSVAIFGLLGITDVGAKRLVIEFCR